MKRICVCCGEVITAVGLNPNTCLDCESMLDEAFPCPGTTASEPEQSNISEPRAGIDSRPALGMPAEGWSLTG